VAGPAANDVLGRREIYHPTRRHEHRAGSSSAAPIGKAPLSLIPFVAEGTHPIPTTVMKICHCMTWLGWEPLEMHSDIGQIHETGAAERLRTRISSRSCAAGE
jgi:hypothetical protein